MAWKRATPRPTPTGWQALRRAIHRRDQGICQGCGQPVGDRWQVDHIVPVAEGGGDDPDNLRLLGVDCCDTHSDKTKAEAMRGRKRRSPRRPPSPHPGIVSRSQPERQ